MGVRELELAGLDGWKLMATIAMELDQFQRFLSYNLGIGLAWGERGFSFQWRNLVVTS